MDNTKNFYVHLISHKNSSGNSEFASSLTVPIHIPVHHNLLVGACNIQFIDNTTEKNTPKLQFAICIPKYLPTKPKESSRDSISSFFQSFLELGIKRKQEIPFNQVSAYLNIDTFPNEARDRGPGIRDFIQSYIEPGNYGPTHLIESLNREIQAKFPASFNPNTCRFIYNSIINRIQLQIDGSYSTVKSDRCTLMVYSQLSKVLGFSKLDGALIFGASLPPDIPEDDITNSRHATAPYAPVLDRSRFFYLYTYRRCSAR